MTKSKSKPVASPSRKFGDRAEVLPLPPKISALLDALVAAKTHGAVKRRRAALEKEIRVTIALQCAETAASTRISQAMAAGVHGLGQGLGLLFGSAFLPRATVPAYLHLVKPK